MGPTLFDSQIVATLGSTKKSLTPNADVAGPTEA